MTEIAFLPIVAAGFANVILGFIWYHPKVFGNIWMRNINMSPEMVERGKRQMHYRVGASLLTSMLTAYVLNFLGAIFGVYDVFGAVQLALVCWVGFIAPTFIGTVLWEQRPVNLYLINTLYWLVSLITMSLIVL